MFGNKKPAADQAALEAHVAGLIGRIVSLHGTVLALQDQVKALHTVAVRSETKLCKLMEHEGLPTRKEN